MLIGDRRQYELVLPVASARVNCYVVGPDGPNSQDREYDYPHQEDSDGASLTRLDELHYIFTTPKLMVEGYYTIYGLRDTEPFEIARVRVDPVASNEMRADMGVA